MADGEAGPLIYEATLGQDGRVNRGKLVDEAAAIALRRQGLDVVVCGDDIRKNRQLADTIERTANRSAKRCPPHPNAGPRALPHYQPDPRPPAGHTFYETPNRKAS